MNNIFWDKLFNSCKQMIYNIAFGILNNKADAEDAVQNIFLWMICNLERVSQIPDGSRNSYIAAVTKNHCINVLKKQNAHPTENIDTYHELSSDISVEKNALDMIAMTEIKQLIGEMPETDKNILQLYYFEGKDCSEISEITGISYNAARTRLHRAKKHLRALLKEAGIDYDG